MKAIIKIFCVVLVFILLGGVDNFPQSFEGKLGIKLIDDGEVSLIDYLIKGGMSRMEVKDEEGESQAAIITDTKKSKMIILMPEDKMYMEYPLKKDMEEHQGVDSVGETENITVTNETREINGFNCRKIIYEDNENMEAWVTQDISSFTYSEGPMGGSGMPEWYSAFSSAGFFPILVIEKDDSGEEESHWEVISAEQKSLSDDLFTPPSDYEKFEMPGMDFLK